MFQLYTKRVKSFFLCNLMPIKLISPSASLVDNYHFSLPSKFGIKTDYSRAFCFTQAGSFLQEKPVLRNQYSQDSLLKSFLRRHVSKQVCNSRS